MALSYSLRWAILFLLGLFIYGQTFHFGFVFDDTYFILNNPYIRSFSHVHLMWHDLPKTRLIGIYTFALNYFFGRLNPQGYHIFNFLVHLVSTGLVWALAGQLFRITKMPQQGWAKEFPFLIAVLFLVHPCQTQAVSYISQRYESMAAMFYLATVNCYLKARISNESRQKILLFALSAFFAVIGIFTKETAITVPATILAIEWIFFPNNNNSRLYTYLIAGGILLYAIFSNLLHKDLSVFFTPIPSDSHCGDTLTPAGYFLTQMRVFLTFLRLMVLPIHQNVDYDYHVSRGLLDPPLTLAGSCVILFFIFLIFKLRSSFPLIAFGLAWVLITFSINLAPRANVIFEHKLYLISFGYFLAIVAGMSAVVPNSKTMIRVLFCIITILGLVSFQRNKIWKDNFTLWDNVIQESPYKERPYNNRGLAWVEKGNYVAALSDYNKAIQINPDYINAYINRGFLFYKEGNFIQAISDDNKAIQLNPDLSGTYINRGNVYVQEHLYSQAIADFNKAIALDRYAPEAYNDRGNAYFIQGNFIKAAADFNKAVRLRPDYTNAYFNLGFIYFKEGDFAKAAANYGKVLAIDPGDPDARHNQDVCYYRLNQKKGTH